MNEPYRDLIARHRRSGIIIDTGVLLLYLVGRCSPEHITRFKRTDSFSLEDFKLLNLLLRRFDRLLTTPNVLTEISNFSGQISEPLRTQYFERFRSEIGVLNETYISSRDAGASESFVRFGLTDATIHQLARESHLVLTIDFKLYYFLQLQKIEVINFNHLRPLGWKWLAS